MGLDHYMIIIISLLFSNSFTFCNTGDHFSFPKSYAIYYHLSHISIVEFLFTLHTYISSLKMHICKPQYKCIHEECIISDNYENVPATNKFLTTKVTNQFVTSV